MVNLYGGRGFRLYRNFSIEGGALLSYQFLDRYLGNKPEAFFATSPERQSARIIYSFADGYSRFVAYGRLRLSYQFGPLTVRFSKDWSLTPMNKGVEYQGAIWPVKYKTSQGMIGLTYNLLFKGN
jgi:hypothetical protein